MPTLKDIARECGYNAGTVSRALQDSPLVKQETKDKIRRIAAELNYKPNLNAKALSSGKSFVITLLVPTLASSSENLPSQYISRKLFEKNYDLNVCQYHEDIGLFERQINRVEQGSSDGVIIVGPQDSSIKLESVLKKTTIPYIYLDRFPDNAPFTAITSANYEASVVLTNKLVKECDGIVHFYGTENIATRKRYEGFMDSIGETPFIYSGESLSEFCRKHKIKKLGLSASVQGMILSYLGKNKELIEGLEIYCAVYDHWHGQNINFKKIFIGIQDWEKISSIAVDEILELLNSYKGVSRIVEVPFYSFQELR